MYLYNKKYDHCSYSIYRYLTVGYLWWNKGSLLLHKYTPLKPHTLLPIHLFKHTFTHYPQCPSFNATASSSGAVMVWFLALRTPWHLAGRSWGWNQQSCGCQSTRSTSWATASHQIVLLKMGPLTWATTAVQHRGLNIHPWDLIDPRGGNPSLGSFPCKEIL